MQTRFALRFEGGERRGETIAITGQQLTLGRRPGNSVQVLDASVSGKHAEIVVDAQGCLLRDLGSTNGTRVAGERVSERRLAHGDLVLLGSVQLLFIDSTVDASPPPPPGLDLELPAATAESAGEGMRTVSADRVVRAGQRSLVVGVALVAVLAGGGFFAWKTWFAGSEAQGKPVEPVSGNLVAAGYSFEQADTPGWEATEDAPARFLVDRSAAISGESGLCAALAQGEWALQRSAAVSVTPRQSLRLSAALGADEFVELRPGLAFESSASDAASFMAWGPKVKGQDLAPIEWTADVPPGYDRVRVVVRAEASNGAGNALADDVALVSSGAAASSQAKLGEVHLWLLGDPAETAVLTKGERVILSDWSASTRGDDRSALSGSARENGIELSFAGGGPRTLAWRIEPAFAAQGVATLGEAGFRTHQAQFEARGVQSVLCATGADLTRLVFDEAVVLRGRPEGAGFRVEAELAASSRVFVQLTFVAERAAADQLAREARNAEKERRFGPALVAWKELLDQHPYEAQLVSEADRRRSALLQAGLEEVQAESQEVERARFFRLIDLYRQCRARATAIVERYAASEVAEAATKLVEDIDRDYLGLERDLSGAEVARLASILRALELGQQDRLAARVRVELERHQGGR